MNDGWIKLNRKIQYHWIYKNSDYVKAWITILLLVNYEDNKTLIHGEIINCNRGQSVFSLQTWASKFGKNWTIQRVRTFFNLLQSDNMIHIDGMRKTTRLTVCNYDTYQDEQQTTNTQLTDKQQTTNTQLTTTKERKERKERKEGKEEYNSKENCMYTLDPDFQKLQKWMIENTPTVCQMKTQMTSENLKTLKSKYSSTVIAETLVEMENKLDLLKKYKSVYLTLHNWLKPKK